MKSKYIAISACILASICVACNSGIDQSAKENTSLPPAGNLTNLPATNATNGAFPLNTTDSNKPAITTTSSKVTAALNPAHGQPGHRCEIAVGAPLTPAATNTTTPQATTTPAIVQPQNPIINNPQPQLTVPATKATAGLNPAHGQPGHRCDISVGAPFNGKATSAASSPANATVTPVAPAISAPAPLQSNVPKSIQNSPFSIAKPQAGGAIQTSNAKLNPAHGQPGHDCKIAVGQPLKQ